MAVLTAMRGYMAALWCAAGLLQVGTHALNPWPLVVVRTVENMTASASSPWQKSTDSTWQGWCKGEGGGWGAGREQCQDCTAAHCTKFAQHFWNGLSAPCWSNCFVCPHLMGSQAAPAASSVPTGPAWEVQPAVTHSPAESHLEFRSLPQPCCSSGPTWQLPDSAGRLASLSEMQ